MLELMFIIVENYNNKDDFFIVLREFKKFEVDIWKFEGNLKVN